MKKNLLLLASSCASMVVAQNRPNIILFLVDDMGWQDTSVAFADSATQWNRTYETPNMARLAEKGVKFTNAYACPVSSPSRISLITGANVTQHQVSNWTLHYNKTTDANSQIVNLPRWNYNGMSTDPNTPNAFYAAPFSQILKDNGYKTIFIGKAHFGALTTPAEDPLNLGFDVNIGGHAAGAPQSYLGERMFGFDTPPDHAAIWAVPHLETYHKQNIFLTEALTLEANKEMNKAIDQQKPFFLYMGHYAVHTPFDKDVRFYQKYIDKGLEPTEARYAALVEGMDKSLGDLMDFLKQKGQEQNTIILFMSDNGGYSVGAREKTYNGIEKNDPLRGGKGCCYEGGIREPMIVYWDQVAKPGTTNSSPIMIEDFYPTILEIAGIRNYHTPQRIDGVSFVPALKAQKTINTKRPLVFHYPNKWGERFGEIGNPQSAIRVGDYKLIYSHETCDLELYNLKTDLRERNNLVDQPKYAKIAHRLAKQLSTILRKNDSPMPTYKADGKQVPYPDALGKTVD